MAHLTRVAPDVFLWRQGVANVYILRSGPSGVVIDTAFPGAAASIRAATEQVLGGPPSAIFLTHGHFDHAGSAAALATAWSIPVFVHAAELPFVRGERSYPAAVMPDPPPRGLMRPFVPHFFPAWLERRLTRFVVSLETLGTIVRGFDEADAVPGLPEWRAIPTPGHSPGHVSFFRARDRVLLSGDALLTLDADSVTGVLLLRRALGRPPSPVTVNWDAAWRSIDVMAELDPSVIAAGHGLPISGPGTAAMLRAFATRRGRRERI